MQGLSLDWQKKQMETMRAFFLLKTYKQFLQWHSSMLSSLRNDLFTTDPTVKKNDTKTPGRPREKRMIGQKERAGMMKANSSRKRERQACWMDVKYPTVFSWKDSEENHLSPITSLSCFHRHAGWPNRASSRDCTSGVSQVRCWRGWTQQNISSTWNPPSGSRKVLLQLQQCLSKG